MSLRQDVCASLPEVLFVRGSRGVQHVSGSSFPALHAAPKAFSEPRRKHTILLAEEDDDTRRSVNIALRSKGFCVVARGSGLLALHAFQHLVHIDLLFCEPRMPGISGQELALTVAAQRPGTPILLASGTAPDATLSRLIVKPGWRFLLKPFREREMLHAVQQGLAGEGCRPGTLPRHCA